MKGQLLFRPRDAGPKTFNLGSMARLGRDGGNEVPLRLEGLSRHHATITLENGAFWLEDAGSTNGTSLNGRSVGKERSRLYHLDVVSLGSHCDILFLEKAASETPSESSMRLGIVEVRLVAVDGPEAGVVIEVPKGTLTMGRTVACNVMIESSAVSKMHARLERTAGQLLITDLNSSNGTFVNGVRITSAELGDGDRIVIGKVREFRVEVEVGSLVGVAGPPSVSSVSLVGKLDDLAELATSWKTRLEFTPGEEVARARRGVTGKTPAVSSVDTTGRAPAAARAVAPAPKPPAAARPPAAGAEVDGTQAPSIRPPLPPPTPKPAAVAPAAPAVVEKKAVAPPPKPEPVKPDLSKPAPKAAEPAAPPEPPAAREPAKARDEDEKPVDATERMRDSQRLAALAMPQLVLVGTAGTHRIGPGEHVVGRVDSCAVVVKETKISRQHATLQVRPAGCFVKDLGSANGTFLNGKKLGPEPVSLRDGDKLSFADALFTVQVK